VLNIVARGRRAAQAILLATLTAVLCFPAAAWATDAQVTDIWSKAAVNNLCDGSMPLCDYSATDKANVGTLPTAFDLRDPNGDGDRSDSVVTPVKSQYPWGCCWAFASIAASETSILSKLGTTYAETPLDLSERQLVNSVFAENGAPESAVGSAQAGEGYHHADFSKSNNEGYEQGGRATFSIALFAAGAGLVPESLAPFQNEEGIKVCNVTKAGSSTTEKMYLTDAQITTYKAQGATVTPLHYAGNYGGEHDNDNATTWSTSENLWFQSPYVLDNGNVLPSTRVLDSDEKYLSTNMEAVSAIKGELYSGRGIFMTYRYDASAANDQGLSKYFDNNTCSHYTWESGGANHAVTIVGWDDNYSASNFKNTEGKTPEGNGAWLVKNSYGAQTEDFPNYRDWGIVENGQSTGYFWISYYDQSIGKFHSFDFDVTNQAHSDSSYTDQYDYLPIRNIIYQKSDTPVSASNVFTAQGDLLLRNLSCWVCKPNTTVTYQVYLLDDQAQSPTDANHAKLVYTGNQTYAYSGYHRIALDDTAKVAMREGQRYAVVTTQKCDTDGKYYLGAGMNNSGAGFHAKVNAGESWIGLSSGDAASGATTTAGATADATSTADGTTNGTAGESTATGASATTDWSDWTVLTAAVKTAADNFEIDNASIKAFSDAHSWASVEELSALEQAIKKAESALHNANISADGADVAESEVWMTQAQHDTLVSALADAKAKLALAGSNFRTTLANTTPTSDTVTAATQSLSFETKKGSKPSASTYVKAYDLRDPNSDGDRTDSVVTSVKHQGVWNTCWAFAATAASETSILSELRQTDPDAQIDLSERYLAWFAYQQVTSDYAGSAQADEGFKSAYTGDQICKILSFGGYPRYATTLFSAGIGPVDESVAPYRNDERIITCNVQAPGSTAIEQRYLTETEAKELESQGYQVTRLYWSSLISNDWKYSTWTVPTNLYGQSSYELEESYNLPEICVYDKDGEYTGINSEGIAAVKEQLSNGRAVAMYAAFEAGEPNNHPEKITTFNFSTWSQYCTKADKVRINTPHAVTIVGWDDNYSASNFNESQQPKGDGAWLVKNSYGSSSTEEFPYDWGIVENGENTGYYWISYYDETIEDLTAYNFDVNTSTSNEKFIRDQYNYLVATDTLVDTSTEKISSSNEFTATEDRLLRAVTCETAKQNTEVTYEVYLLADDAASPTDGELAYTDSATYAYGGFHRLMIDNEDGGVAMRKGQRYSIVVTQKCGDEYVQVAAQGKKGTFDSQRQGEYVVKVNAGESWTYENGTWADWKGVSEAKAGSDYVIDNFAIKGLSTAYTWPDPTPEQPVDPTSDQPADQPADQPETSSEPETTPVSNKGTAGGGATSSAAKTGDGTLAVGSSLLCCAVAAGASAAYAARRGRRQQ
jgi:C1A family cysteine protease